MAVMLLALVAVGLAFFVLFSAMFFGFSIGGASPALEAVYRLEDTVNLVGAGVVAVALAVAGMDLRGWRRGRLLGCVVLTALCVVGGLFAQYGLRHSPAELDPSGGHRANEVRDGRIHWQPLAIGAGLCTLAVIVGPQRRRHRGAPATPGVGR